MSITIKQSGSITQQRSEAVDRILSYLAMGELDQEWTAFFRQHGDIGKAIEKYISFPLNVFDGAQVVCYESLLGTTSYDRMFMGWEDDEFRALSIANWDTSVVAYHPSQKEECAKHGKEYLYTLQRYRRMKPSEVRGLFRMQSGKLVEYFMVDLCNDGTYLPTRSIYELRGGHWFEVGCPFELEKPVRLDESSENTVWLSKSMALTAEYDWRVDIGLNRAQLPTIGIPSDPVGAREVFKLRDVPAGKSRRDVLRHWVSQHYRRKSESLEDYSLVLPYLRGAQEFTWNGLYCKITPSVHDLRKAREFELMRAKTKAATV